MCRWTEHPFNAAAGGERTACGEQMLMPIWAIVNLHKRHFRAIAENTNRQIQIPKSSNDVTRQFNLTAHCSQRSSLQACCRWFVASLLVWNGVVMSANTFYIHKYCTCVVWRGWSGCRDVTGPRFSWKQNRLNWAKMSHIQQLPEEADIVTGGTVWEHSTQPQLNLILTQTNARQEGNRGYCGWREPLLPSLLLSVKPAGGRLTLQRRFDLPQDPLVKVPVEGLVSQAAKEPFQMWWKSSAAVRAPPLPSSWRQRCQPHTPSVCC